jgi:endoglucanase
MQKNKFLSILTACAGALVVAGILIAGVLLFKKITFESPDVFTGRTMVESLWERYKRDFLEEGTLRAIDHEQEGITTSEGQSYTMLRAVWIDDKETFDTAWQWTKDNLQHENDRLISWLFGKRADDTYGILTDRNGQNSATDADVDIALALLFASRRWNDERYFGDAIVIIRDIWDKEVAMIGDRPYLLANDVEKTQADKTSYLLNPSYYSPYAYKIFAQVDPDHDWEALADTSYEVLNQNLSSNLDKRSTASIPSDWIVIDKTTGEISAVLDSDESNMTTNYSYDALRLPWRLALDALWFNDIRAKNALRRMGFFENEWNKNGAILSNYAHDGSVVEEKETAAMYGGILGLFKITNPSIADEIYEEKLESLFNTDRFEWKERLEYYDANWAWFGMALYNDMLPNLYPATQ